MATLLSPAPSTLGVRNNSWPSVHAWKVAALVLLGIWVLAVGAVHEPWFDEAQAWLIARDSGLYELFAQRVRYEGTPGLWHAILWITIRAGLPYGKLYLLSASCAIAGAAVVLWRAPFPAWMRVGIIFSYFFAYQFSVLARSYSVDLLVVPLLAAWYPRRTEDPLRYAFALGLLANLNAHGFVAGAALGLEFAWQLLKTRKLHARNAWLAIGVASSLGLFALLCAWQPSDNNYLRGDPAKLSYLWTVLNAVRYAFVGRLYVLSGKEANATDALWGVLVTFVALGPSIKLIAVRPARWASAAAIAPVLLFSIIIYGSPWHSGLIFLFWIFALWISWPSEPSKLRGKVMIGFAVIVAAQMIQTATSGIWDVKKTFSPGSEAAAVVEQYRRAHPTARVAGFGFKSFAVQPYSAVNQFANYKNGAPHASWVDWRRGEPWDPMAREADWVKLLDRRPDLIVASLTGFHANPSALIPAACKAGYVQMHLFEGAEIWRGADYENDTLVIFERGPWSRCRTPEWQSSKRPR